MRKKQILKLILMLLLLGLTGQIAATAVDAQGANLLTNPSFEQPYQSDGAANGWVRWDRVSDASQFGDCANGYHKSPQWGAAADFVYDGSYSQYVGNNWDTWSGGVWQNVSVTPGATYEFSFFARGRGSNDPAPAPSETGLNMNIRAGIDPNGSGLWLDSDVVWSGTGSPHDTWQQFTARVIATGNTITVFTWADWGVPGPGQCRQYLSTYYDKAQLVEVAPAVPPTNTPAPPPPIPAATNTPLPPTDTPTPAATATNTPVPSPTASPTPTGATICVNAFADENGNGAHDDSEGYMAGVTFTVASSSTIAGQAVSPGRAEPVCFPGLTAGSYQIAQIVSGRLEMTTAANAMLEIEEGKTYGVEFGSRVRTENASAPDAIADANTPPTAAPATAQSPADDNSNSPNLLAVSGIGALVLGVILLGVLIFALLRRG